MKKYILLPLICFVYVSVTYSQDGTLDDSFDQDGIVTMDLNNSNDVMKSILTQTDGKIIVAGYTSDLVTDKFCLVRFNGNGSIDTGFGSNGVVITTFLHTSVGSDIALQNDGKIVVAGHTWGGYENNFALARYHADGSLDASFGNLGMVSTSFSGQNAIARTLKIQNDGKIIVAGNIYTLNSDFDEFALARYNLNGSPDTTFGSGGQVTTSFGAGTKNWINSIQLQDNGKIVAGGFSNDLFALARYNSNGSLDPAFGTNGLVTTTIPNTTQSLINSLALSPDGSIYGGGYSVNSLSNFTIVKYDSLGMPDNTFGLNGILIDEISIENDAITDVVIQADNKLLVAGSSSENSVLQFALARYDSIGNIDTTFGTNGIVKTLIDSNFNQLQAITLQSDGKILATGIVDNYPYDLAIVRYSSTLLHVSDPVTSLENFSFCPNPTQGQLHLTFTLQHNAFVSIKLFNMQGRLLQENLSNVIQGVQYTKEFQLNTYSSGVYFINISFLDINHTFKIIKE